MKVGVIVICYLPSGLNDNLNPNLYKDFSGEKTYFFLKDCLPNTILISSLMYFCALGAVV